MRVCSWVEDTATSTLLQIPLADERTWLTVLICFRYNAIVRHRSPILASELASAYTKSEPRRLKSWALLVEMGESRTPRPNS
jgi:hypothetical protein